MTISKYELCPSCRYCWWHSRMEPDNHVKYIHCLEATAISIRLRSLMILLPLDFFWSAHSPLRNIERNIFQKAMEEDSETDDMPQVARKFGPLTGASCAPQQTADAGNFPARKVYPVNMFLYLWRVGLPWGYKTNSAAYLHHYWKTSNIYL